LHTASEIAGVRVEVERIFRARDLDVGRTSAMDKPHSRAFFRSVVSRHAEAGQVRLTCVHIDGRLAAYVLCFLDGDVVRMWNCRFDPELGRYSPGKIAMDASVRHALEEGALAYDFMRGEERYKDGYANHREVAVDLSASSHGAIHAAESLALRAHKRLRVVEASGGRAAELAGRVRGVIERATD
jgi:CelD/BcsL family acetyltransferase involved in cellulose biosynthesis